MCGFVVCRYTCGHPNLTERCRLRRQPLQPSLQMTFARQRVGLAPIALGMRQHKVVGEVTRIQSERNEVINIGLLQPLPAVEAPRAIQLPQAGTDNGELLPRDTKEEILQVPGVAQDGMVPAIGFDVPHPVIAGQLLDKGMKPAQAVRDTRPEDHDASTWPLIKERVGHTDEVLQVS